MLRSPAFQVIMQAAPPGSLSPTVSQAFRNMYQDGGVQGMWRGNFANCIKALEQRVALSGCVVCGGTVQGLHFPLTEEKAGTYYCHS